MLGRHYGLDTGIDSTDANPLSLNAWLTNLGEDVGYTSTGGVYWPQGGHYFGFEENGEKKSHLKFKEKTTSVATIHSYLDNLAPVIGYDEFVSNTSLIGHYFVIDSRLSDNVGPTYTVRDPRWYKTITLRDEENGDNDIHDYGNDFQKAVLYTYLQEPERFSGFLEFTLASPAELLLIDSAGRKTGMDAEGILYEEIPGALYGEEDHPIDTEETLNPSDIHRLKSLYVPADSVQSYSLFVIGTGSGAYTLTTAITTSSGTTSVETFTSDINPQEEDEFVVTYSPNLDEVDVKPKIIPQDLIGEFRQEVKSSSIRPLVKLSLLGGIGVVEKFYNEGNTVKTIKSIDGLTTLIKLEMKKKVLPQELGVRLLDILGTLKSHLQ